MTISRDKHHREGKFWAWALRQWNYFHMVWLPRHAWDIVLVLVLTALIVVHFEIK